MPRYEITGPDGSRYEVSAPDGASQDDVLAYAQSNFKARTPDKPYSATEGIGPAQTFLEGMGKGFVDLARGAGERVGLVSPQEVADARKYDAPLMKTGAGTAGSIAGNIAAFAPAAAIPGANSVLGAGMVGALSGALQPTIAGESAAKNTLLGAAIGGGAQFGLGKLAGAAQSRLAGAEAEGATQASQNSVRDAALKASQEAGYVVPPSMANAGLGSRILEGVSGKYKTNQFATIKNQNVTESLARKALGMAADEPITPEAMQAIRGAAFEKGYAPLANAGSIETDRTFQGALDKIVANYQGASRSFPGAVRNDVLERINGLRTGSMDLGDGLKMTQILRDDATAAYARGDKGLGKATRQASDAIEDQIERALTDAGENGAELLKNFRDARTLMAKAHTVEQAIEGGKVNAKKLGAVFQKKPGRLTDELRTIGQFANNYGDVAGVAKSGFANPFTIMDFAYGGATGSPALPLARVAARHTLLNPAYQKALVGPSYGPGLLTRGSAMSLEEMRRLGLGGLLVPSINATEQ